MPFRFPRPRHILLAAALVAIAGALATVSRSSGARSTALAQQGPGTPLRQVDWDRVLRNDPNLQAGDGCLPGPALSPDWGPCLTVILPPSPGVSVAPGPHDPAFTGFAVLGGDNVLYGDLDGDGLEEAVIRTESGGTGGSFGALIYHQATAAPQLVAVVPGYKLSILIRNGTLVVRQPFYFGSEANCCPTAATLTAYALDGTEALSVAAPRAFRLLGQDDEREATPAEITVAAFYRALDRKAFDDAYALLSADAKAQRAFDAFKAGYVNTESITFSVAPGGNANEVRVQIMSVDGPPSGGTVTKRFAGTWSCIDDPDAPLGKYLQRAMIDDVTGLAGSALDGSYREVLNAGAVGAASGPTGAGRTLVAGPNPVDSIWAERAPLLAPNSETAVAQLGSSIYVLGGYPSTRVYVDTVEVYDAQADRWDYSVPLPQRMHHTMATAVNGILYVIGGEISATGVADQGTFLDTVYAFDPATARWTQKASMPTERSAGATAIVDGKIYIAGGRPPHGHDFAVYDPATDAWTVLPDLPTQRNHLVVANLNGKVYVAGGRFGGGVGSEMTNILEVYDPLSRVWSRAAPMPTTRAGINGIMARGCLYVWGGEGNDTHPLGVFPQNEVYDPRTDSWQSLESMPIPVHGVTGAAYLDGWIHLPGGGIMRGGNSGSIIHQVFRAEVSCEGRTAAPAALGSGY